jgi:ATP-binding cassette subfamily F protein 3
MKALLQISNLGKRYGGRILFENATATFLEKQKVGVVGRNGAGKSTLFRIIVGEEEADEGEIVRSQELVLSYLEQRDPFREGESVLDFLARYTEAEPWRCGEVAGRFKIKNDQLLTEVRSLSGGYQMRVKLAAMLLREPNFLILDEPTNYLDLNTLILLESFLTGFNGAALIISHDREFLKRTCDHTLEVDNGRLFLFPGNIEEYLEFKEEEREQKIRINRSIDARQKELQSFVERFRAKATKAAQAQSRMKMLEKLQKIEIDHPMASVQIHIPDVETKSGIALRCESLSIGYPGRVVGSSIDLLVERGQKIAVLGDNGQGKTTLLRTIAGEIPTVSGVFRWGPNMRVGYYAQHVYKILNPEEEILSYLERTASPDLSRQEVLNMAGAFLFRGDDVKKRIAVLSGGERARLCLAGILLSRCHAILLDEPTNHLDFETVEALGAALRKFSGTVVFVSHDRTFVNQTATRILEVKEGRADLYPGSYEDYVYRLELLAREEPAPSSGSGITVKGGVAKGAGTKGLASETASSTEDTRSRHQMRKDARLELNRSRSRLQKIEGGMAKLELEREAILRWFEEHPTEFSREQNDRLEDLTRLLADEEESWLSVQQEIERLEATIAAMA